MKNKLIQQYDNFVLKGSDADIDTAILQKEVEEFSFEVSMEVGIVVQSKYPGIGDAIVIPSSLSSFDFYAEKKKLAAAIAVALFKDDILKICEIWKSAHGLVDDAFRHETTNLGVFLLCKISAFVFKERYSTVLDELKRLSKMLKQYLSVL